MTLKSSEHTFCREGSNAGRVKVAVIVIIITMILLVGTLGCLLLFSHKKKAVPKGMPRIDIVFDLDCTGSMAGELKELQDSIMEIMTMVKCGKPLPYVRFGLSGYRDKGDDYLVFKYDMADNTQIFQSYVNGMRAEGGGDLKESVNESLHTVLNEINWDKDPGAKKIMLLIGDAGPHMDYHNGIDYNTEIIDARKRGIKIFTVGCSGIEKDGEREFRAIAEGTGGTFQYLTYRQKCIDKAGGTSYRFKSGKNYYSMNEHSAAGENWKNVIDNAIDKGIAKRVNVSKAFPSSSKAEMAPGEPQEPREIMESNIDAVCIKIIRQEMQYMGIKFDMQ